MVHIFNTTGKRKLNLNISYEDYKISIQNEIELATEIVNTLNKATKGKGIADKMIKSEYIMKDGTGNYFLNDTLVKLDLMLYKIEKQIYQTGVQLKKSYDTNGILSTEPDYKKVENTIDKASKKMPFKDAYLRYSEIRKSLDFGQ